MRMPAFWQHGGARLPALLLAPLGWIYGWLTHRRMQKPGWRAPVPVISIGNFTAGGAGKTPTAIAIAEALKARGEVPFFLTRGYGGRMRGPIRVDTSIHDAAAVGDEPLLLLRHAAVIVARDRAAGARLAITEGATCLVLDDALQNPSLRKDFSLAVIDGGFGFGNGNCVPAGPLRQSVDRALAHVDAILIIGRDEHGTSHQIRDRVPHETAMRVPEVIASSLAGKDVTAFCGIGRPEKFRTTLEALGTNIRDFHAFADHHPYSDIDARRLIDAGGDALLVTTEKDHVRLRGSPVLEALAAQAMPVPITVPLGPALIKALYSAVDSARNR